MFKKLFLPLVALFIALGAKAEPQRVMIDKVVAIVGTSPILHSEVSSYARQLTDHRRSQGYSSDRDPMVESLEYLMMQKLLYNQALVDSVEINTVDIMSRVEMQVNEMAAAAGGIVELEKLHNMELFNIRNVLRKRMEENSYAQAMRYQVEEAVTIVPGQVESFYNSVDIDSLPIIGEQYVYAQITRFPTNIEEAKRRTRERLLDMRGRVVRGETRFSALAQMYSVDPGSATRGGEMDPQPSSAFVPAFADALEALQPGQVSEIVETEFGYHIIELIDVNGDMYHCRHILLRPSYSAEELQEPITLLDSLVTEIRNETITFNQAALIYSDDDASKMNGGIVSNHDLLKRYNAYDAKLTVTKFLKEDFGARGYKSIDDFLALSRIKEGEISNAFTTEDMMGNQMGKIVKLIEIIPSHKASLNNDYLQLEEMALADLKQKRFESWLTEHIKGMYIHLSDEYKDADFENPTWAK